MFWEFVVKKMPMGKMYKVVCCILFIMFFPPFGVVHRLDVPTAVKCRYINVRPNNSEKSNNSCLALPSPTASLE